MLRCPCVPRLSGAIVFAGAALLFAACTGGVQDATGPGTSTGEAGAAGTTSTGSGGSAGAGGTTGAGTGGSAGTTATGSGGSGGTGGTTTTGAAGSGGRGGTGGTTTTGTGGTGGASVNCSGTVPTGGTVHTSMNQQGTLTALGPLVAWSIWSNSTAGSITTYGVPAFSAAWNNSGDFLARLGIEWGNRGMTFDKLGTVTAQFAETKTGTGGGFSYIGIYGWSNNPCIEWYIIDDSYSRMPVNPGSTTSKGTAMIDGGTYNLYTRPTSGTGGSRCTGVNSWTQFYSVRTTARQCGQISITDHFNAWAAAGMTLGTMLEAKILVEVGGGAGSIDFTTASVTAQ
jgi:hypothetical protein